MVYETFTEAQLGRTLEREVLDGAVRFKPGQHEARPSAPDLYVLSYVAADGHAWKLFVSRRAGAWYVVGALEGGLGWWEARSPFVALDQPGFDALTAALEQAAA